LKGNFRKALDPDAVKFSSSLKNDIKLFREDIEGSLAHLEMLARQKIISGSEAKKIKQGLIEIRNEIESGKLSLALLSNAQNRFAADDIHMVIEKRLIEKIGDVGGKLHTARSRNDQVALDERIYLRAVILSINKLINRLQKTFVEKAGSNINIVMPGYTHLQQAQPILLPHHLLAYVSMLQRDKERLSDCLKRVNLSPLGAGAFAGTSFPIDRKFTSKILNFDGIISNSIDAVSDRDVLIEFIAACSIIMMHLSRFAEELVIWSSQEWNFVEIGDEFTTGSSMMPQKKNPDMAELIRGKTGRVNGDLIALLTVMKGLPLAYNRDMQEDKEPLFDAAETVSNCLTICSKMLKTIVFNKNAFNKLAFTLATDIADYLANKNFPFRKAHTIAGSIVKYCEAKNISFKNLSLKTFQKFSPLFKNDVFKLLDIKESLKRKKSEGSTSPEQVRKAIKYWRKKLN